MWIAGVDRDIVMVLLILAHVCNESVGIFARLIYKRTATCGYSGIARPKKEPARSA